MNAQFTVLRQGPQYTFIWQPQLTDPASQSLTGYLCWATTTLDLHQQSELQSAIDAAAQAAGQMGADRSHGSQPLLNLGRLLFAHLLPSELQDFIQALPLATPLCICTNDTELPWELLHDEQDFLALRHAVTRQMLVSRSGNPPAPQARESLRCLLIGNPTGDLAEADAEVESLLGLFHAAPQAVNVEFLCREHASKLRVLAALARGDYDVIHFACHARPGALRLADGWLQGDEIQGVLRGQPLIYLNACRSGRSGSSEEHTTPFAGEQVHNLAEAFLTGGASAFLGTAWPVSDEETRWLALEFYRCVLSGTTVAAALRQARLRSRSRHDNAISWSAPTLYCDLRHRLPPPSLQRQLGTILTVRLHPTQDVAAGESLEAFGQRSRALAHRLTTLIKNYGGRIIALRPDYVRALFGVPDPVEDDAIRAIRAALEICAVTETDGESSACAVTSGEFVVAQLAPDPLRRAEQDADAGTSALYLGAVFAEADALAAQSQRNQVLTNPRARQMADGHFTFFALDGEETGSQQTGGELRQSSCYEATALLGGDGALVEGAPIRWQGDILGRERELRSLTDDWQRAAQGQGQVVGIVGEAGVGKSRLLAEYRRTLQDDSRAPAPVWIGLACSSTERDTPYMLVRQLLRKIFGVGPADSEATVDAKVAHRLRELSGDAITADAQITQILRETLGMSTSRLPDDERRARRGRLVHLLRTLMANTATQNPLIIAIDDIHWIDDASLEVLGQVTDGVQRLPVQFVVVYRPEWVHSWFGKAYYHHLPLDQLDPGASVGLLRKLLQSEALPKGLAVLLQKTGGNPFFIEEMVKSLQETGLLVRRAASNAPATWVLQRPLAEHHLPGTVERALRVRLESLTPTTRDVLEAAAIIGPTFALPLLQKLLATLAERVEIALSELEARGFVEARWDTQEYHFRHALILDTVYKNMPARQHQAWHRRIAEALQSGSLAHAHDVETLAHHYYHSLLQSRPMETPKLDEASDPQQVEHAVQCLIQCGQRALERYATREAINYFQRSIFLHKLLPAQHVTQVASLEGLGDALNLLGDFDAAYQQFRLAYGALHTHPLTQADRRRAAELARRIGRLCAWRGEHEVAIAWIEEGLRALGDPEVDEDKAVAALLHVHRGSVEYNRGNYGEVTRECERGLELAQEIERPLPAQAEADNLLGIIAWANGRNQDALAHYTRSRATWQQLGNSYQATRVEGNMGVVYVHLAQWEEARRYHARCKEYWEHVEDQDMLAHPCLNLGNLYLYQGDWEQAETNFRQALALWSSAHHERYMALSHTNLGMLYIEQADWAKAQVQLEESCAILTQANIRDLLPEALTGLAEVALGRGDLGRAHTLATDARDLARDLSMRPEEALALRALGRVHLAQGDVASAQRCLETALDLMRQVENRYEEARTLYRLAEAAQHANDPAAAQARLEQALALFRALGAKHDYMRAQQLAVVQ